jgi:hypothetical protein
MCIVYHQNQLHPLIIQTLITFFLQLVYTLDEKLKPIPHPDAIAPLKVKLSCAL